ncbi:hypothetical protein GJ496_008937 [Pomphorhynchus laevis]|nr:hypothetical protein GJ496_008937 [Pomphorhynchus laevis]
MTRESLLCVSRPKKPSKSICILPFHPALRGNNKDFLAAYRHTGMNGMEPVIFFWNINTIRGFLVAPTIRRDTMTISNSVLASCQPCRRCRCKTCCLIVSRNYFSSSGDRSQI